MVIVCIIVNGWFFGKGVVIYVINDIVISIVVNGVCVFVIFDVVVVFVVEYGVGIIVII